MGAEGVYAKRLPLPEVACFDRRVAVTGSGGFIGAHLKRLLLKSGPADIRHADVSSANEMAALAREWDVRSLVHLAAAGTVLTELAAVPRMLDVTIDGLVNCLDAFRPDRVLYSSSCAVYGDSPARGGAPGWEDVHPIGCYGLSKAMAEKVVSDWARRGRSIAINFRVGNVVGEGCAGLISYLVRHAANDPEGRSPAHMRGGGMLTRDFVPVDYVVHVLALALDLDFEPGTTQVFNLGSGITMTNGEVASIVTEWLEKKGYRLNVVFEPLPAPSEARFTKLQTESARRTFGLNNVSRDEIREAIVAGARSTLAQLVPDPPVFS